jgi:hypothetical protein
MESIASLKGNMDYFSQFLGPITVSQRFDRFITNLMLTSDQRIDGMSKHNGVRKCLNKNYYNLDSGSSNSMLVGSWGKSTEIRPPRDIDILFILPRSVYDRFQLRNGNIQSQLLQEVKDILMKTYSTTKISGDGQVVVVPFASYAVEVAPAFLLTNSCYWICDTNGGGRYKEIDPNAEIKKVQDSDSAFNGNTRHLIRMMKCWQGYCSVSLKSFCIELLAIEFLQTWDHRGKSSVYYDWMVRDFFKYVISKAKSFLWTPGTYEAIWLEDSWVSKAQSALGRAVKACDYESQKMPYSAGEEWQKIFGTMIPLE